MYTSDFFTVRPLTADDADEMFRLFGTNPYYFSCEQDHPVTRAKTAAVLTDLPPGRTRADKHVIGFFEHDRLAALMDYIDGYPDPSCLFIGLFMVDGGRRRQGLGRKLIAEFLSRAAGQGYGRIRLGCIAENRESFPFWSAMGFREVSRTVTRAEGRRDWNIIVMERPLP